jgi:hypothetical protein
MDDEMTLPLRGFNDEMKRIQLLMRSIHEGFEAFLLGKAHGCCAMALQNTVIASVAKH